MPNNPNLTSRIQELNACLDNGDISQEEFDQQRKILFEKWQEDDESNTTKLPDITTSTGTAIPLKKGREILTSRSRFKLLELIGGGTNGQIWKAEDLQAKKDKIGQVIKVLKFPGNEHFRHFGERDELSKIFEREANHGRELNHTAIVNTMWFDHDIEWPFIVMEYLEGDTLQKWLTKNGNQSLEKTLEILKPIAESLDHAHAKRIIHRDIKPANIIITKDGAKLLDFGEAAQIRATTGMLDEKENRVFRGTETYAAPELYGSEKKGGTAQDIYSFACVIYEMLTGEPPFTEKQAAYRKEECPAEKPKKLTEKEWGVLEKGLAIKPEIRPVTALDLIEDIECMNQFEVCLKDMEIYERLSSRFFANGDTKNIKDIFDFLANIVNPSWISSAMSDLKERIDSNTDHLNSITEGLENSCELLKEENTNLSDRVLALSSAESKHKEKVIQLNLIRQNQQAELTSKKEKIRSLKFSISHLEKMRKRTNQEIKIQKRKSYVDIFQLPYAKASSLFDRFKFKKNKYIHPTNNHKSPYVLDNLILLLLLLLFVFTFILVYVEIQSFYKLEINKTIEEVHVTEEQKDKSDENKEIIYTVKYGDSFIKISKKFSTPIEILMLHNPKYKHKINSLKIGDKILMPPENTYYSSELVSAAVDTMKKEGYKLPNGSISKAKKNGSTENSAKKTNKVNIKVNKAKKNTNNGEELTGFEIFNEMPPEIVVPSPRPQPEMVEIPEQVF